jgi:drug/metabolite transporter (DMT)-like permease
LIKLAFLTFITLLAFAANSVLCRLALLDVDNAPVSFTLVRLGSGAVPLIYFFLKNFNTPSQIAKKEALVGPVALFMYAIFFSLAYVNISAGMGALILFASVQFTMVIASLLKKQKLNSRQKCGFIVSFCGLIYLLLPGLNAPPIRSAVMMAIAGISWGIYSLNGQRSSQPVFETAKNFIGTLPILIVLFFFFPLRLNLNGWTLAIISGAVTSALGYVLWYMVLKRLTTTTAAIIQLSVPAIAAFGGVIFLGEHLHFRLVAASVLILGGIVLKIYP